MASRPDAPRRALPDFTDPPVIEVALSVVFNPLPGYTAAHTGLFWNQVSDRFVRAEHHPPVSIPEEIEAPEPQGDSSVRLVREISLAPPLVWLLNTEGTELLQVQRDAFIRNWRKQSGTEVYPRYKSLRERFVKEFGEFMAFTERSGLGAVEPKNCEVSYVNHMPAGRGWNVFGEMHKVVSGCAPLPRDGILGTPEETTYAAKFAIRDQEGQFVGRLNVSASPAFRRSDKHALLILTSMARGRPRGAGLDGVLAFFDIAHEWIVCGFTELTTTEMQRIWGRIQ